MRLILILGVAVMVLVAACKPATDPAEHGRTVVAGFYPLAEAARRIGGACVTVTDLTPPGVEPHDLELTPGDVEALATADVVLTMGGGFQPAVDDGAASAEGIVVDVLDLAGPTLPAPAAEAGTGLSFDPHLWLDPGRWAGVVRSLGDVISGALPGSCDAEANAETYARDLESLDAEFARGLARCDRRVIVTTHAAFGYLADAYGLTQASIAGLEPEGEPSAQHLADLRDLVARDGLTTIFTEDLVAPDVAETLATEAGVGVATLHTVEGLTDAELAAGDDYRSAMMENLATLREALSCG